MTLDKPSDDQLCYPGSNISCVRTEHGKLTEVVYMVFYVNILINIVGNSVVILSIGHFKQLHSPTNVVVLSLAVTDLLLGVTVVPFSMTQIFEGCWFYGDTFCELHTSTDMILCSVSILHLVCIALDRYEAVCNPMRYTNNITMSVARVMVLACWVLAALHSYGLLYSKANVAGMEDYVESIYCLGSCNLFYNTVWAAVDAVLFFFLPGTAIVGLYTKIFLVANEHAKKIKDRSKCVIAKGRLSRQSEHKAAKTLGIVVGAYICCWTPYFVSTIIDFCTKLTTPKTLFEIFYWLAYFNSTMNPIIYAMFYPWFRRCFRHIFSLRIFERNSSDANLLLT